MRKRIHTAQQATYSVDGDVQAKYQPEQGQGKRTIRAAFRGPWLHLLCALGKDLFRQVVFYFGLVPHHLQVSTLQ